MNQKIRIEDAIPLIIFSMGYVALITWLSIIIHKYVPNLPFILVLFLLPLILILTALWKYKLKLRLPEMEIYLSPVENFMEKAYTINEEKTGKDAEELMEKNKVDFINIVDGKGNFKGIFTKGDALIARRKRKIGRKIKNLMTPRNKVICAYKGEKLLDIIEKIGRTKHSRLPVIDGEKVIGVISSIIIHQLLSRLLQKKEIIKVAICTSRSRWHKKIVKALERPEDNYKFDVKVLNIGEIIKTNLRNYDVLIVPGCDYPFIAGYNQKWKNIIRKFVEDGGGYIGICAGAMAATLGFENADTERKRRINKAVLKIANLYVNSDEEEEMKYDTKESPFIDLTGIPLIVNIENPEHFIFKEFKGKQRSMQWHCGPGLYKGNSKDRKMGNIDVLATFDEEKGEPCKVAPIHEWKLLRWEGKRIKTDIGGQYAIIATTYGKGRIVLFSPHPENATWYNGHVKERFGWYWWRGRKTPDNYNWWMLRKAVIWAYGVDH